MALRGLVIREARVVPLTFKVQPRGTGAGGREPVAVMPVRREETPSTAGLAVALPMIPARRENREGAAFSAVREVVEARIEPGEIRSAGLAARGVLILPVAAGLAVQRAVQRLHKLGTHMIPDAAMVAAAGPEIRKISSRQRAALGVSPGPVAVVVEPMRGEI